MPKEVYRLGVVAESRPPVTKWSGRVARPISVMAVIPHLSPGTLMSDRDGVQTHYLGDHAVVLHSGETRHYIDNLTAKQPSVWVAMDHGEVTMVSVDPYEGEALASDPQRVVEALPMPVDLARLMDDFIQQHHVEEVFRKRKRIPATAADDPGAPRILKPEDKWVESRGRAGQPARGKG